MNYESFSSVIYLQLETHTRKKDSEINKTVIMSDIFQLILRMYSHSQLHVNQLQRQSGLPDHATHCADVIQPPPHLALRLTGFSGTTPAYTQANVTTIIIIIIVVFNILVGLKMLSSVDVDYILKINTFIFS